MPSGVSKTVFVRTDSWLLLARVVNGARVNLRRTGTTASRRSRGSIQNEFLDQSQERVGRSREALFEFPLRHKDCFQRWGFPVHGPYILVGDASSTERCLATLQRRQTVAGGSTVFACGGAIQQGTRHRSLAEGGPQNPDCLELRVGIVAWTDSTGVGVTQSNAKIGHSTAPVQHNGVQKESSRIGSFPDQTVERSYVGHTGGGQVHPLGRFAAVADDFIRFGHPQRRGPRSVPPAGRKSDLLSDEALPHQSGLLGVSVGWIVREEVILD